MGEKFKDRVIFKNAYVSELNTYVQNNSTGFMMEHCLSPIKHGVSTALFTNTIRVVGEIRAEIGVFGLHSYRSQFDKITFITTEFMTLE